MAHRTGEYHVKAWMLDDWELAALAALVVAIVIARKRRERREYQRLAAEEMRRIRSYVRRCRHPVPGLDVDGEPLTSDERAALNRIEIATLTSLPAYDDGGELL